MIVPNFATRPFINTRPVWLVTTVAGILTVILVLANIQVYLESNQALATQLELRDRLLEEHADLETQVRGKIDTLGRVPWRSLVGRVSSLNVALQEHAFSWLTLLDDLGETLPMGVRIVSISPSLEEDGVILGLDAVAKSREDLLVFLDNLFADPRFSNPLPRGETWPEGSNAVGYNFNLKVTYNPSEVDR